jgi:tRNA (guanine-N7-)-methyltransferase
MDVLTPMSAGYGGVLSPRRLKLPLDLERLSGGLPKTALEIGFGNGEYTVQWAAANPDVFLIGLEVSFASMARCARRIESAGLGNLKILRAGARFMTRELFADESLDRVMMNFPCPWPKTRHARRRVTAKEFIDGLAAVLKVGGSFELVTDEPWYAENVRRALSAHGAFSGAERAAGVSRPAATKYERKWLKMGKEITRLTAAKANKFTVERRAWGFDGGGGRVTMHVKTGKPLPEKGLAALELGTPGRRGDAKWVFRKYYAECGERKNFLVETISTDDDFEQRYYLKVAERGGGALVRLDGTARVFLTPSVRFAAEDLARRLSEEGENPGLAADGAAG